MSLIDKQQDLLIEQVKQGDRNAFRSLYKQHCDKVFSLCWRLLADKQLAEDATQECFIRVWKSIGSFRAESSFKTWLYRLATNVALDHLRKQKRWWLPENWSHSEDSVEPNDELQLAEIDKAIVRLPEKQRLVFVLFAVEGNKHSEIARMLKIAEGSSKSHYHQARQQLKEWLDEYV